jgi:hypothetical protein
VYGRVCQHATTLGHLPESHTSTKLMCSRLPCMQVTDAGLLPLTALSGLVHLCLGRTKVLGAMAKGRHFAYILPRKYGYYW